tara:strand:+ start:3880 stop:4152 length:273 start_codon:yes stop_codon:yes gene_type:complete
MPRVGRARWTPNPNSKVVKRQINNFSHNMPAGVQVLQRLINEGGGLGGGNLSGEGKTDLTLGDANNDGSITIKSTHPENTVVQTKKFDGN